MDMAKLLEYAVMIDRAIVKKWKLDELKDEPLTKEEVETALGLPAQENGNGGGGGATFNLTSITPSGMLEADVQTLIDQKIATKVATIPPTATVVYKYTPKPFFAGLAQPPVTAVPISGGVADRAWNTLAGRYYSVLYSIVSVAMSETKVFAVARLRLSDTSVSKDVLVSWDVNELGTMTNYTYCVELEDSPVVSIVASSDGSFVVVASSDKKVRTIVYNKVTARYELKHTMTMPYFIQGISLTGDSSQLLVDYLSGTGENVATIYESQGGSWVAKPGKVKSDLHNQVFQISKDGLMIVGNKFYNNKSYMLIERRTTLSDAFPKEAFTTINGVDMGGLPKISGDGKVLYVGKDNTIKTYSINADNTFTLLEEAYSGSGQFATSYDVSLDGKTIAMVSEDGKGVTVYRKEKVVATIALDANSLDPFEDGSLKHFYKLDGDAVDSIGGANGTILDTVTWEDAKFGKGAKFVFGDSSSVIESTPTLADTDITVSFWLSPSVEQVEAGANATIVDIGGNYTNNTGFGLWINTLGISLRAGQDYNHYDIQTPTELTHCALVYSRASNKLFCYFNGEVVREYTRTINISDQLTIGNRESHSETFGGLVDHLQIFNRALTQEEVTKLYVFKEVK